MTHLRWYHWNDSSAAGREFIYAANHYHDNVTLGYNVTPGRVKFHNGQPYYSRLVFWYPARASTLRWPWFSHRWVITSSPGP